MNIRDLKYLVAIASTRHFGKAAEACFISQPALSMQIKKLENVLGVQLIERTNKSAMLTQTGEIITEQAKQILHLVNTMKDIANQAKDPFSGELHLGVIPTLAPYLLPHIMPGLTKRFPKLKIFLVEEQTHHLITKLKEGKLDSAIFGLPLIDEDFSALPLFEEELLLALPSSHPLTKRKSVRFSDLSNKVLLLLEDGHCLREQALSLCHSANASADTRFKATSLETLRHMVASHAGITLMPKLAYRPNDGITYLPFTSPKITRTIGLIWRPSSVKQLLLENIVMQIKKSLTKHKTVNVINTPIVCRKQ